MKFLKYLALGPAKILKIFALVFVAMLLLVVGFRLIGSTISPLLPGSNGNAVSTQASEGYSPGGYAYDDNAKADYGEDGAVSELSARSTVPSPEPPYGGGTTGSDAEDFEVTQYNVSIETRNLERTCGDITDLKSLDYVIFENANEYDHGCNYTFKVAHDNVPEIVTILEDMDPRDLSENTYTIKRTIDNFTSELEILENKLATINQTLEDAVRAYDNITAIATRTQDAESLAKIIDSKIGVIERLTIQRINITAQLERLSRSKADQLDRLDYTYFYINVFENKFIDGEDLADSWKAAIKDSVRDINRALQDMTVNLFALLFGLIQYIIYLLILFFVVKYGWRFAKHMWNK
jgi:hypothetical protein